MKNIRHPHGERFTLTFAFSMLALTLLCGFLFLRDRKPQPVDATRNKETLLAVSTDKVEALPAVANSNRVKKLPFTMRPRLGKDPNAKTVETSATRAVSSDENVQQ